MDRGTRGSAVNPSDTRKRGKLPTLSEQSAVGPQTVDKQNESSKFKGSMVAPSLPVDRNALVIDPDLLVGPWYVPQTTKTDRIKEQLGDITEKLHKTLYTFDEFDDFKHEDPAVALMRERIGKVDDKDMRSDLVCFMDQYEDMSSHVAAANRDRDDMLMQLADWFTTDHVDLDDIKSSVDDSEEESIKQSYFQTMTNFEKLKKVQQQIANVTKQGKSTRQLQQRKIELEKDVVGRFKVMKDMSMQTMKLKSSEDEAWKHAANEIVSMLNSVRAENTEEMALISKKTQEMVDGLERQAKTIKSLTAELREKKHVMQRLTDENCDLSQDVMQLRIRQNRYEKDLQAAQTLIHKLDAQKLADGRSKQVSAETAAGKSLTESVSKFVSKTTDKPQGGGRRMSSDPQGSKVKDYQEALETSRSKYARASKDIEDLNVELGEKKTYVATIEAENEKLSRDVKKLKQERRQLIAAGTIPTAAGDTHKCEHCKCHVTDNESEEETTELKKEAAKWQEKCTYFKKCLADTEMKLSNAFREISDLRMEREFSPLPPTQPQEQPAKKRNEPPSETMEHAPPAPLAPLASMKQSNSAAPKLQPKKDVKPRYLDMQKSDSPQPQAQPPIERTPIEEIMFKHMPDLTPKQNRELKLYRAGDLQGKLNMLVSGIMEFVSEIGKMLHVERNDEGYAIQTMKAIEFDSQTQTKKQKELRDTKEEEAKQKKSMVIFSGQHACAILRDAFETLSGSLNIQHAEYEAIYHSFKISQQRNNIRQEVVMGRMPASSLQEFDRMQKMKMGESGGADSLLYAYFTISYGGGGGAGMGAATAHKHRQNGLHRRNSSLLSVHSDSSDESEAKLKNTMHVLSVQRSKSDIVVRNTPNAVANFGMMGGGMLKERSHVFMPPGLGSGQLTPRHDGIAGGGQRQEMRVGMAVVNKKGLISLSTMDESRQLPELASGENQRQTALGADHAAGKQKNRSLIKRKDIMDHFKAGFKILEDEELQRHQEEDMQKSLGDYTIMDLQSRILEMTDAKSIRRIPGVEKPDSPPGFRKGPLQMKQDKNVTLPAIKNIDPFAMKS